MEEKIFNFYHSKFAISFSSSLRKGRFPLSEQKFESPSPKDALCQVWVKLAWYSSGEECVKNFVNVFSVFRYHLPLRTDMVL